MKKSSSKLFGILKRIPQGAKASFAFFFANLVKSGIVYLTTPLYTRLLTTSEYGQTAVFLTWLNIFGMVAMFCLHYGVFNNGMVDYPARRGEFSLSMLGLSNVISLFFALVLIASYPLFRTYIGLDWPFLLVMLAVFLTQPAYNFWLARQRYELKWKWTTFWVVFSALAAPLVALAAIKIFPNHRLYARILGEEGVLVAIYVGFFAYLAWTNHLKVNTAFWRQAVLFNLPLIPHYLSMYLLAGSDKLMISKMVGPEATAYYSVSYSVAAVVIIIWRAAHSSLIPFIYESCKARNFTAISKVTIPILALFCGACTLLVLLAPEIVAIMATANYREAIYVIPPVVVGVFFQVHYFLYADVLYYYKKPRYVMFGSVTAALANIAMNGVFIPRFGYVAAGYTTLACYFLQAGIDYWAMRHVIREKIYDMRLIVLLSVALCAIAFVCLFVYDILVIRYSLLALLILALFQQRRRVIRILTAFKKKPNPA